MTDDASSLFLALRTDEISLNLGFLVEG